LSILREFLLSAAKIQENWGISMSPFNLLFSFKGRITRSQYWMAGVVQTIVLIVLIVVVLETLGLSPAELSAGRAAEDPDILARVGGAGLALLLGFAVLAWTAAAIYTKRLHDRNKGAIWLVAIYGPALSSLIIPPLVILSLISMLWVFIELGCLPGTPGPNRFDSANKSAYLDDVFGEKQAKPEKNTSSAPAGYGGMEAAMKAVAEAARSNPSPQAQMRGNTSAPPQFGQRAPAQFGRLNTGATSGGFGRRV
jgi:uncharacterized membrane protein YhaH (DUF805 family)